ncbi:unnamed protein product, partial [Choristocarpus tenellus]
MPESSLLVIVLACALMAFVTYVLSSGQVVLENVWRKAKLGLVGTVHMLFSKDKKFKQVVDPQLVQVDRASRGKRIIFIRHGESEWNEVFNRGYGPGFLIRLIKAIIKELMMLTTRDSVFFDSPLSDTGIRQVR